MLEEKGWRGILVEPRDAERLTEAITVAESTGFSDDLATAYLNFAEAPTDLSTAFPTDTFHALQAVKATYDPNDTIHANHAIAPADCSTR